MSARPHVVYRLYDRTGVLLYVGLTCNVVNRFREHGQTHPWFSEVVVSEYEHFPDGLAAEAYAIALIAELEPLHNQRTWRLARETLGEP